MRKNSAWLCRANTRTRSKETWAKVREVMHGRPAAGDQVNCYGLSAQQLNHHYSTISTDAHYRAPPRPVNYVFAGRLPRDRHVKDVVLFAGLVRPLLGY